MNTDSQTAPAEARPRRTDSRGRRIFAPSAETRRKLEAAALMAVLFNGLNIGIAVRPRWGYPHHHVGYRHKGVCLTLTGTGLDGAPHTVHSLRAADGPHCHILVDSYLAGLRGAEFSPPGERLGFTLRKRAEQMHRFGAEARIEFRRTE